MNKVIISSIPSDSHTWNLVYLQLLMEEYNFEVVNLGPCVPIDELVQNCYRYKPDFVVISTVNGHGHSEGVDIIKALKCQDMLRGISVFIGGKIGTLAEGNEIYVDKLLKEGFDDVFINNKDMERFIYYLHQGERKTA